MLGAVVSPFRTYPEAPIVEPLPFDTCVAAAQVVVDRAGSDPRLLLDMLGLTERLNDEPGSVRPEDRRTAMSDLLFTFDELSNVPATPLPTVHEKVTDPPGWGLAIVSDHPVQLVERVARSIWDADAVTIPWGRDSWRTASESHRDDYRRMARGALLALGHDFDEVHEGCRRCGDLPGDGPICEGAPLGVSRDSR